MRALLLGSSLLAFAACGGRGTLYTHALAPLPLVATSSALVHVVPTTSRAVVLAPGTTTPTALRLSDGARLAQRIPHADALVVLTGGPRHPTMDLVDLGAGAVEVFDLPGYFDQVTFSDDGRFGVFTYDAASTAGPLVARNLNEVALLTTGSRTISRLQLDTESLAPRGVLFAPAEANRQLVAVRLERGVALFDALHPEVAPRRITLRPPGSAAETAVVEALFSRDVRWLFLRATALDDVIAIELGPEVGAPVSASINFVSGGRGLADLEVAPEGMSDAVLAAYSTSRELWLLDAHGIQDRAKKFSSTEAVSALTLLGGTKVLGWSPGAKGVVAWDVADGRAGTSVLDGAVGRPWLAPAMGKAMFFHPATTSGGASLTAVTLTEETNRLRLRLQAIQLARPMQACALDAAGQRLFFSVNGSPSVVTLELATLQLAELPLDTGTTALFHLDEGDWLAATSGTTESTGDVTLWPAGEVDRAKVIRFSDYLFTQDFDRAEAP